MEGVGGADVDWFSEPEVRKRCCIRKLVSHLGVIGFSGLLEDVNAKIADERFPEALRSELEALAFSLKKLESVELESACEAYVESLVVWHQCDFEVQQLGEGLKLVEPAWAEVAVKAQGHLDALRARSFVWAPESPRATQVSEVSLEMNAMSRTRPVTIPLKIREYEACEKELREEYDWLFQACNQHATHNRPEGLKELTAFEAVLEQLGKLAKTSQVAALNDATARRKTASTHYSGMRAAVASVVHKLPSLGGSALVRLADLLKQGEYASFQQEFAWLLPRPRDVISLRVTTIRRD